jgi:hypothetical protein
MNATVQTSKKEPAATGPEIFLWKPPDPGKEWREHYGYYGVAADGTVYLPAAVFADQLQAVLCAGYDGEGFIKVNGNDAVLFRASWLKEIFPAHRTAIEIIEARIEKKHLTPKREDPKREGRDMG